MIGRGGTSFVPVFKRIEELELDHLPLVYFTDLAGDFPKTSRNHVYWITRKSQRTWSKIEPPFGTTILINE
jgi:predicted metal-dependent peptidase